MFGLRWPLVKLNGIGSQNDFAPVKSWQAGLINVSIGRMLAMTIIRAVLIAILVAVLGLAGFSGIRLIWKRLVARSGRVDKSVLEWSNTKTAFFMLSGDLERVLQQSPTNLLDVAAKLAKDPLSPECRINSTNPFPSILPPGHYEWVFTPRNKGPLSDTPLLWRKFSSVLGGTVVFVTFAGEVRSIPQTNWIDYLRERNIEVPK